MYGCGDRVMYNVGMSSWVPSTVSISNSTTLVLHKYYISTTLLNYYKYYTTSTTTSPIHRAHLRDHQCSQPSPADQGCSGKRKLALKLKILWKSTWNTHKSNLAWSVAALTFLCFRYWENNQQWLLCDRSWDSTFAWVPSSPFISQGRGDKPAVLALIGPKEGLNHVKPMYCGSKGHITHN